MFTFLFALGVISLLIFVNAFYVAAEFATVSARRARLAQMAEEGHRLANLVLAIVTSPERLDNYIAACQLGITLSSLVLGFYGQAALAPLLVPWLTRLGLASPVAAASVAATTILLVLTTLQVLLGELVPKSIGVQYPERLALLTALPMQWSLRLFRPLIWFFNGSGRLVLRLLGLPPATEQVHVHSPEEILVLVEESTSGGLLDEEERRLLENTLRLRNLHVGDIMIPRTQILAAPADRLCNELLELLAESPHSRLPLYEGSIDNIVGIVHLKDLLCLYDQNPTAPVRGVMRKVLFIPMTTPVEEALKQLQRERTHLAIVLDEYGGTAGMITVEDLIEEIFGEFRDEFDVASPFIQELPGHRVLVRGDMPIDDLNEVLEPKLPTKAYPDIHTIGGLVLAALGRVPEVGEEVPIGSHCFRVEKMEGRRVAALSLQVTPQQLKRLREWSQP